jgi:hypothetical protein
MTYSVIPRPGSRLGPCVPVCRHRDCLENREQALWACFLCHHPLGFEVAWTIADDEYPVHIDCLIRHEHPALDLEGRS